MLATQELMADAVHHSDPDLSFQASRAAVELDNLLNDEQTDLTVVRDLATALVRSVSEGGTGSEGRRMLMDPSEANVFSQAFASTGSRSVLTLQELVDSVRWVAEALSKASSDGTSGIRALRDFCLALSRSARAQFAASLEEDRPGHPYRR